LKRIVENKLNVLRNTLADYTIVAIKHNILVEAPASKTDSHGSAIKTIQKDQVASLIKQLKAKAVDLKKKVIG
jgi:hypothetical protein